VAHNAYMRAVRQSDKVAARRPLGPAAIGQWQRGWCPGGARVLERFGHWAPTGWASSPIGGGLGRFQAWWAALSRPAWLTFFRLIE
jgi:hypothetical protein